MQIDKVRENLGDVLRKPVTTNALDPSPGHFQDSRIPANRNLVFFLSFCVLCVCDLRRSSGHENENLWALEVPFSDKFLSISPEKVIDACTKLLESKKDLTQEQTIAALHQRAWALQFLFKDTEACKDYDQLLKRRRRIQKRVSLSTQQSSKMILIFHVHTAPLPRRTCKSVTFL